MSLSSYEAGLKIRELETNLSLLPVTDHVFVQSLIKQFKNKGVLSNKQLFWDSLMYQNAAGENYSISRLQYYISHLRFFKNTQLVYFLDTVFYVDAMFNNQILLNKIPAGAYDSMAMYIGVDPTHNIHGKIPATAENIAMQWPINMGGGYHFLKLEGHWLDNGQQPGFAIHLGTNPYLIHAGSKGNINVGSSKTNQLTLTMNINEWFTHPLDFSFSKDGGYTMGEDTLMQRIMENGKDVFSNLQ